MKIQNKYIIGTHIMFYEIEMVKEHVQSIINAIETVDNRENITVDLFYNISEYFEKINTEEISKDKLIGKFIPSQQDTPSHHPPMILSAFHL